MKKELLFNLLLVLLCICAILINTFWDDMKAIGAGCIISMGLLAMFKDKIIKKHKD